MTRADLEALARRCESEEASQELYWAIADALGWKHKSRGRDNFGIRWVTPDGKSELCGFGPPDWTTSLDAAVSLEPKDAQEICVRKYREGVYVRITLASGKPVYCEGFNNPKLTEPLARCAAALRARAMEAA